MIHIAGNKINIEYGVEYRLRATIFDNRAIP